MINIYAPKLLRQIGMNICFDIIQIAREIGRIKRNASKRA